MFAIDADLIGATGTIGGNENLFCRPAHNQRTPHALIECGSDIVTLSGLTEPDAQAILIDSLRAETHFLLMIACS
jgi:hypothetical protein